MTRDDDVDRLVEDFRAVLRLEMVDGGDGPYFANISFELGNNEMWVGLAHAQRKHVRAWLVLRADELRATARAWNAAHPNESPVSCDWTIEP